MCVFRTVIVLQEMKKFYTFILIVLLVCSVGLVDAAPDVIFTDFPVDMQVYPRLPSTNIANIKIVGTISSPGYDFIIVKVYRESVLQSPVLTQQLVYSGSQADFNLSSSIKAELANYDFTISIVSNSTETIIGNATNVVGGDVFLVNGQSNAVAGDYFGGTANWNQGPFLRSFGTQSDNPISVTNDLNWHLAEGDMTFGPGAIGQWAIHMGRILIDELGIPIAIINNARGGQPISYFKRNDNNTEDIETNYGRLLFRAKNAGVTNNIRAVLWYQGESDEGDAAVHEKGVIELYNNWLTDYPGIEKVYIHQLRVGCGVAQWDVDLRNRQRLMPDKFPAITVMSTTGLNNHDGCHFGYQYGYEDLGTHNAGLVKQDLYNSTNTYNIDPPNVNYVFFNDSGKTNITIVMRNIIDSLVWDAGSENYFKIENTALSVTEGKVVSNTVILHLDGNGSGNIGLTYSGHSESGPWILNGNGVGLLTFYKEAIYSYFGQIDSPENFAVKPVSFTAIQLNWTAVSNVVNYLIKRDGKIITSSTSTTFVDELLAQGTEYCYQVASVNPNYTSEWSEGECTSPYNEAPRLANSQETWALWHMDSVTNHSVPPAVPWYVHDDDSPYSRDNDLQLGSETNVIVNNSLYLDGSYSFKSVNDWNNADAINIDFYFKPLDFSVEQILFEITGSISVRIQPIPQATSARVLFYIWDNGGVSLTLTGWKTVEYMSNKWNHVIASVLPNGNFSVSLDGADSGNQSGLNGIDNAYAGIAYCCVGADHLNNNRFTGYLDEVRIGTIPEVTAVNEYYSELTLAELPIQPQCDDLAQMAGSTKYIVQGGMHSAWADNRFEYLFNSPSDGELGVGSPNSVHPGNHEVILWDSIANATALTMEMNCDFITPQRIQEIRVFSNAGDTRLFTYGEVFYSTTGSDESDYSYIGAVSFGEWDEWYTKYVSSNCVARLHNNVDGFLATNVTSVKIKFLGVMDTTWANWQYKYQGAGGGSVIGEVDIIGIPEPCLFIIYYLTFMIYYLKRKKY